MKILLLLMTLTMIRSLLTGGSPPNKEQSNIAFIVPNPSAQIKYCPYYVQACDKFIISILNFQHRLNCMRSLYHLILQYYIVSVRVLKSLCCLQLHWCRQLYSGPLLRFKPIQNKLFYVNKSFMVSLKYQYESSIQNIFMIYGSPSLQVMHDQSIIKNLHFIII